MKPDAPDVMAMMAEAEFDRGRTKEAAAYSRKAIELDPNVANPYAFIGTLDQTEGRRKEAKANYEKYLQLAPTGKYASDLKALVKTL